MEIKFNMNQSVKVKLTELGIKILKEEYEELQRYYPDVFKEFKLELDENGYYEDQLWSLMSRFGKHICMGCKSPFETNIILETK